MGNVLRNPDRSNVFPTSLKRKANLRKYPMGMFLGVWEGGTFSWTDLGNITWEIQTRRMYRGRCEAKLVKSLDGVEILFVRAIT